MPVDSTCTEYDKNLHKWRTVRDCDEGASAIKMRPKGAQGSLGGLAGQHTYHHLTQTTAALRTNSDTKPMLSEPTL